MMRIKYILTQDEFEILEFPFYFKPEYDSGYLVRTLDEKFLFFRSFNVCEMSEVTWDDLTDKIEILND